MQASGTMAPANRHNPARTFHPDHTGYLHVGHRRSDGTMVWLSMPPRDPSFQQVFRDHNLSKVSEKELDIEWLNEFKIERFSGSTTAKKKQARRQHLNEIISANRVRTTRDQPPALEDPNRPTGDAPSSGDGSDGHVSMDEAEMTSGLLTPTQLIVSTTDQSNHAPFYVFVSLEEHWTTADLFESLIIDCNTQGQAVEAASTIRATFLWNGRTQVLRRDRPEDWIVCRKALRRAWEEKGAYLWENGCEVEMVLCVETA